MKEAIRSFALELGFDLCRFTTADAPRTSSQFTQWLVNSHQGGMTWLARNADKRNNPQLVLPGVRSVICVAASYHDAGGPAPAKTDGVIARYARFNDYHEVLGTKLSELARRMDELSGMQSRSLWYVDTGPVLEREFAERAGIGFVGKHTNVISRELGNWILLGEILTTAEFPPDEAERNHCGNCEQCIYACPTRAITSPFKLDARRCISYLTIELKEAIPEEFRPLIGSRIFGCDDCLQICPWNRFAREGRLMRPHATARDSGNLIALLGLEDSAFKKRFAGSPILRAKRRGLLRNVCVALGNVGGRESLPALSAASTDKEPLIAEHALWAISRIEARNRPS
jgi:epoxyqueuosine reductase